MVVFNPSINLSNRLINQSINHLSINQLINQSITFCFLQLTIDIGNEVKYQNKMLNEMVCNLCYTEYVADQDKISVITALSCGKEGLISGILLCHNNT